MDVFVYGTLTDPDRAETVLDDFAYRGPAVLEGCHRVGGAYPTLAPGGRVEGRLLRTDDIGALDRYEGVESGLYVRVSVPLVDEDGETDEADAADADRTAETYVGDPQRLDAPAEWPGQRPFAERVRSYLRTEGAVLRTTGSE